MVIPFLTKDSTCSTRDNELRELGLELEAAIDTRASMMQPTQISSLFCKHFVLEFVVHVCKGQIDKNNTITR